VFSIMVCKDQRCMGVLRPTVCCKRVSAAVWYADLCFRSVCVLVCVLGHVLCKGVGFAAHPLYMCVACHSASCFK
jgi:hypothetical protein